jgi:hypothetical protein
MARLYVYVGEVDGGTAGASACTVDAGDVDDEWIADVVPERRRPRAGRWWGADMLRCVDAGEAAG